MPPIVFVAGPLRSPHRSQVAAHVLTAQAATVLLVQLGCIPYCPHTHLGWAQGQITEPEAAAVNDHYLSLAEAVYRLPGWYESFGTRRELRQAATRRIPILETPDEVRTWLAQRKAGHGEVSTGSA